MVVPVKSHAPVQPGQVEPTYVGPYLRAPENFPGAVAELVLPTGKNSHEIFRVSHSRALQWQMDLAVFMSLYHSEKERQK